MAPYFFGDFSDNDYSNVFKEVPFRPGIGRGKEARVGSRSMRFLSRVKYLTNQARTSGGRRGRLGGRGGYVRSHSRLQQRVLLKARVVRTWGRNSGQLDKHIFYLQREGVGIDGGVPEAFNARGSVTSDKLHEWAQGCEKDRHHFRFILSPEKGSDLDLKLYARGFMRQAERDLGTRLSWAAVTHHNTDNPHVHIILRGRDDKGKDLVISREYISNGARSRASELATRELGLRTGMDVQLELQRSVTQARIVGLDHGLIRQASWNPQGLVDMRNVPEAGLSKHRRNRDLQLGRLSFLEGLGLAVEVNPGTWRLEEGLLAKLHSLGIRNDIIKTMHRRMRGISPDAHVSIFEPDKSEGRGISGKVLHVGLVNELYDTKYLLVEDSRRRVHYVSLGAPGTRVRKEPEVGDEVSISVRSKRLLVQSLDRGRSL